MTDKELNTFYIGFIGVHSSFRPVRAKTLSDAKDKFAEFHKIKRSGHITASRNVKEMQTRYSEMIK
jgi:predicted secreted protein